MDWAAIDLIAARHPRFQGFIVEYSNLTEQELDDLRWDDEIWDDVEDIQELDDEGQRIYEEKFPVV